MLKPNIVTPYRGVIYHLKEYLRRGSQNAKELFNLRHSSLRNVIGRTFRVIKKRFPTIVSGTEPYYDVDTMTKIALACCILHIAGSTIMSLVEPSGVQVLKNPNPLKDVEACTMFDVAVLV